MNDTGPDSAIDKAVQTHNLDGTDSRGPTSRADHDRAARERQRQDYRDPSLWWFSSTGCPLIAGTFGPLANAFSICALVQTWRVRIPEDAATETAGISVPDPVWLLAVNAASLVCALAANTALLLNMSRRLRFKVAQPISVVGFFLAGALLLADIGAVVSSPTYRLPPEELALGREHELSSAFFFGIEAAVIYLVITGLMMLTAWGAWAGHFEGGFRLTFAQRTLMVQTMSFVVYILLGALVFSHVEGWEYLSAVYWADVSVLTIGLGSDFHPSTHTGRSLLIFFEVGGILMVGLIIGSVRTLVLDRGKRKLSARMMEKKRLRAIHSINPKRKQIQISRFNTMHYDKDIVHRHKQRELEFHVMRGIQAHAERDRKWMALLISTTAAGTLWLLGALVFSYTEVSQQWSYFDSVYFSYTSLLTLGYGDLYPQSYAGRAFFVLWTLLAVPTLTILISDMSETVITLFSDAMLWIGSITVLPNERGAKATLKAVLAKLPGGSLSHDKDKQHDQTADDDPVAPDEDAEAKYSSGKDHVKFSSPDTIDSSASALHKAEKHGRDQDTQHPDEIMDRLIPHLQATELLSDTRQDSSRRYHRAHDAHFYHVVLAREISHLTRDLASDQSKQYTWVEWEYFLNLMEDGDPSFEADKDLREDSSSRGDAGDVRHQPDATREDMDEARSDVRNASLVPTGLRHKTSSMANGGTFVGGSPEPSSSTFTWLGTDSPLLSWQGETQWVLERLGVQLERQLVRERRRAASENDTAGGRLPVAVDAVVGHMQRMRLARKEASRNGEGM